MSIMDDMKPNLNELGTVIKTEKIERYLPSETLENSLTGQTLEFILGKQAQTSEEHNPSMLDDLKQDFTKDLKNVIKIEKVESSYYSETPEITSTGHTIEEFLPEETRSSEEQNPSMLDDIKQDFENDLKNAIKMEKTQFISQSKEAKIIFIGQTIKQALAEKIQKKKVPVNQFQEITLKQDSYVGNTSKKDSLKKSFKCTICQKEYYQFTSLKCHMIKHLDKKPFKCTICQKEFNHLSSLKCHEVIHSGEKPFKCTICPKEFKYSKNLKQHMVIHSDKKSFKCTICQKEFKYSTSVKKHMVIHSDKKPFKCTICQKEFKHHKSLKYHEKLPSCKAVIPKLWPTGQIRPAT